MPAMRQSLYRVQGLGPTSGAEQPARNGHLSRIHAKPPRASHDRRLSQAPGAERPREKGHHARYQLRIQNWQETDMWRGFATITCHGSLPVAWVRRRRWRRWGTVTHIIGLRPQFRWCHERHESAFPVEEKCHLQLRPVSAKKPLPQLPVCPALALLTLPISIIAVIAELASEAHGHSDCEEVVGIFHVVIFHVVHLRADNDIRP